MTDDIARETIIRELGYAGFHSRRGKHAEIFYRPLPGGKQVVAWISDTNRHIHLRVPGRQAERVHEYPYIYPNSIRADVFDLARDLFLDALRGRLESVLVNNDPQIMRDNEFNSLDLRLNQRQRGVDVCLFLDWHLGGGADPLILNPGDRYVYLENLWGWLLGFPNTDVEDWFEGVTSDLVAEVKKHGVIPDRKPGGMGTGASRKAIQEAEKWLGFDVTEPQECDLERLDAEELDEECLGVVTFRERENVSGDRTYHVHRINTFVSWVRDKDGWADTGPTIGVIGQPEFRSTESARLALVKTLPPDVLNTIYRSMEAVLAEHQIRAASLLHRSSAEYVLGLMRLLRDVTLDRPFPGEDGPDEAPCYRILRRDSDEGSLTPTEVTIDYTVLVPWLVTYAGGSKDGIPRDTREAWLKFRESLGEVCESTFREWRDGK